jgi:hypothetical protein
VQSTLITVARLLPALAGAPTAAPDTMLAAAPAGIEASVPPMLARPIDWAALQGERFRSADTAATMARQRPKAVEYSGFYQTRLRVHRILSYTMIPLFIGSYVTGDQILKHRNDPPEWATKLHKPLAIATGTVFAVNTITGVWNLWDSRKNPAGQTKRTIHSLLFIAASAGFTYAGTSLAHDAKNHEDWYHFHRTVAVASMGVSVLSWGMMVFLK